MKIKSVGKAIINGSAEMKKLKKLAAPVKKMKKLQHKSQKATSTGSAIVPNWIEYAIYWNTNKT